MEKIKFYKKKSFIIVWFLVSLIAAAVSVSFFAIKLHKYYEIREINLIQKDITRDEDKKDSRHDYYQKAISAYQEKDYNNVITQLDLEIKQDPQHAQAYFLLGRVYEEHKFETGKYFTKMMNNYEKYLELKPQGKRSEYVKLKLAQYYIRDGLRSGNVELLNKAQEYLLSIDQNNGLVKMSLGAIYMNYEQYEQAIHEFESAASLPDQELKLKYNSLGLAFIKIKKWESAERCLEIAITLDPKNKYSHYMLGFVRMQLNKLEEAKISYEDSLKLDPKYKYAKINLRRVQKLLKNTRPDSLQGAPRGTSKE
jgi:tetratricopeptide (TPR) repeat protein